MARTRATLNYYRSKGEIRTVTFRDRDGYAVYTMVSTSGGAGHFGVDRRHFQSNLVIALKRGNGMHLQGTTLWPSLDPKYVSAKGKLYKGKYTIRFYDRKTGKLVFEVNNSAEGANAFGTSKGNFARKLNVALRTHHALTYRGTRVMPVLVEAGK